MYTSPTVKLFSGHRNPNANQAPAVEFYMRHLQVLRAILSYPSSLLAPLGVFLDSPPHKIPIPPGNFNTVAFGGPQSTIVSKVILPFPNRKQVLPPWSHYCLCWEYLLQLKRLYLLRAWAVRGCYRGNLRGYFSKLRFSKLIHSQ